MCFVDIHDYAHVSISESSVSQINCGIHFDLEFYNYNYDRVTRLRTPMTGKRKAEIPAQRTARLEQERETSKPLHTCASLSVSPCILGFHVRQFFSPVTSHKPFFTVSYISTTRAHPILDTYAQIMHTGVHKPHPLA